MSKFRRSRQRQARLPSNVKGDKVFEFDTLEAATFSVDVESNIAYTVTTPDWITYENGSRHPGAGYRPPDLPGFGG